MYIVRISVFFRGHACAYFENVTEKNKFNGEDESNRELLDLMRKYDLPCSLSGIGVKPTDEALEEYYKILKNSSAIEESGPDANIKLREALEYLWGLGWNER